jgi:peptidoglycan biosynthesis protein MviN/MurJ (putative lipid II flippase)
MPFYAMISIVTRALNVAGQTQATLIAAIHALVVNATGSVVAVWLNQGVEGLAWANALSTLWQYFVLRHYLKKHAPDFLAESLIKPSLQVVGGSLLLLMVTFQGYAFLHNILQGHLNEKLNLVLSMGLAGGIGMAVYALFLDKLGYPERDLLRGYANKVLRFFGLQLRA